MPFLTAETTDELDNLATFAQQQVGQVATTLHGLSPEQLRQVPSASGMSLGALARHVLLMAETAARTIAAAPEAGSAPDRAPEQYQAEGGLAPEAAREEDTAESLTELLQAAGQDLADAIRGTDPETRGPMPDQPWFEGRTSWSMRWYALHLVEENARHAGHADILRESIDGKGTYELNALAAEQTWPPEGW
ncbi:mycothiol transferase [Brachybacterium tyrofermentans]|uniref:mycothiol transferase n=1 Tax=Brachybacterium tyrofermentans TaxID=47848 RepID=UPI003F91B903